MRSWITFCAKLAVSAGLIALILTRIDLAAVGERLAVLPFWAAALVLGLSAAQFVLAAERWRIVAHALGVTVAVTVALRLTAIGLFFNQGLPSTIGGDALRIYYVRRLGTGLGDSVRSVLLDRLAALLAVLLLVALGLGALGADIVPAGPRGALLALTAIGFALFGLLLILDGRWSRRLARWATTRQILTLAPAARRIFLTGAAAPVMGYALANHVLSVAKVWVAAVGMAVPLGVLDSFVLFPSILLLSVVPISIAGWGVREGAMVVALGFVGIAAPDALAVSLVIGLSQIALGLPGAALWLAGERRVVQPKAGA